MLHFLIKKFLKKLDNKFYIKFFEFIFFIVICNLIMPQGSEPRRRRGDARAEYGGRVAAGQAGNGEAWHKVGEYFGKGLQGV
jgi:hypothetical protein